MSWLYELERRRLEESRTRLCGLRPPPRRRLHWGRVRPRSGMLRLEQRGRFGQTPRLTDPERYELVNNKLGAP